MDNTKDDNDSTMTTRELGATHRQDDQQDETKNETRRDEELTPTEPHKCAYIHWERSQSNWELGT